MFYKLCYFFRHPVQEENRSWTSWELLFDSMIDWQNPAQTIVFLHVLNFAFYSQCRPEKKLPALYLMDSIMKNLEKSNYRTLFCRNIVHVFTTIFEQVRMSILLWRSWVHCVIFSSFTFSYSLLLYVCNV